MLRTGKGKTMSNGTTRRAVPAFGALCLSLCAFAQQGQTAGQPGDASAPETVYKATVRSVIVDVVVTDQSGRPVTGLTREQFHVAENSQPQTLTFFEPHTRDSAPAPLPKQPPLEPGEYTNVPLAPVTDSVNVLLLDALNTPLANQAEVRQAMVKYLKTAAPGTRIAIFTLGSRLRFVQGFTADPAVLLAALSGKKKKALPQSSALLDTPADADQRDTMMDMMAAGGASAASISGMQQFQQEEQSFQLDMRVRITLDAMQQIARYLAGVPGRKNLIWFSGAFPVNLFPDAGSSDSFSATRDYSDEIHQATDLLSVGQVAVYPVDARGLMVSPVFDASNTGRSVRTPSGFSEANASFILATEAEHRTMDELARSTGGKAIYNTNGLRDALTRVIDNGSNYYTLAYTPTNKALDGKLRKIDVKLDDKKYKLSYRRSYFADDLGGKHTINDPAADRSFQTAMSPGLPGASQIIFKMRALPMDPQPAPGSLLGDNTRIKGPTERYEIDYAASVRALHFTDTPDGMRHGLISISIVAYDNDANPLNWLTRNLRLDLKPETYEAMTKTGFHAHAEIDLPKGIINLRTGIFDAGSRNMGILDVPLTVAVATRAQ